MTTFDDLVSGHKAIAVVGLGYVGLPLAVALSRHFRVLGMDISTERIRELRQGHDRTREVPDEILSDARLEYTSDASRLAQAGVIIVAVPTPIDEHRIPDLRPIVGATVAVGKHLVPGSVVVYESTVYPGLTEEVCVPLLEEHSSLACGRDFTVGYSPERINPGDRVHRLETIVKVVAGQDGPTLDLLADMYSSVVEAGVHRAPSIKVAEAAKVIENTQRDLNIALMNELSLIFDRMDIDTRQVLEAAGTKWNFLSFHPGLVGGHCIGVDPYYLTFKAEALGYHPQVILAGRRINDNMHKFVAEKVVKQLIQADFHVRGARVGVLGLTFKENCPDLRNTRVVDLVRELQTYGIEVLVHDPLADGREAKHYYEVSLHDWESIRGMNAVVLVVAHDFYRSLPATDILDRLVSGGGVVDIKSVLDPALCRERGVPLWRL